MFKLIKYTLIGIPVVIIAIIAVLFFSLNSIIKHGVETVGPLALGTEVKLKKVNISLFSGKGELKGIHIGNPEGFHTESSFELDEVRLALNVSSLFSGKIIIDEIYIDAPEITYEKGVKGDNIKAILDNINDFAGTGGGGKTAKKTESKSEKGPSRKIQINNFIIKNGKVNMSTTALKGEKLSLALSDIHLKDIGSDKEGASIADAVKEIFEALNTSIAGTVAGSLKSITKDVEKAAEKTVGGAVDKLKGLFGK